MSTETLRPDGELSDLGLVPNSHLDHDEDPDVSSAVVSPTGNNTNTEWGGDFPTPSNPLTVGADLQEFRVGVVEFDPTQTGVPTARIELWENGTLVRAGSNTNVEAYAVLAFTWNANELATSDGSLAQCKVIGTKTGGPSGVRNTVRLGHMEWNAETGVAPDPVDTREGRQSATSLLIWSLTPTVEPTVVGFPLSSRQAATHIYSEILADFTGPPAADQSIIPIFVRRKGRR